MKLWSMIVNRWRLRGRFLHLLHVRKSRKILKRLRSIQGDGHQGKIISYLRKIPPLVFEEVVLSALEDSGFTIRRNKRYTGDGGVDGWVIIHGRHVPIQCKRYCGFISKNDVMDFSHLAKRHQMGLFIHTGKTGSLSKKVKGDNVKIISGWRLVHLIKEMRLPL